MSALLVAGSFLVGHSAHADVGATVAAILGKFIELIIWIVGKLLIVLINILIWIASYNSFITSDAVTKGWTIVRDLANMFFVVILLIIAFATILRVEQYSYKKLLPKLLIMAVLINFSKLICGIFIDVAEVIMLTFVNGFKDIGGGNLTDMLGLQNILSFNLSNSSSPDVTFSSVAGAYILALIYVLVALVVITVMVCVLAMRMIMIWIYIVLSPLAYVLSAFPAGQKYSSQWWGNFSKYVITGPLLAFFIWLSFVTVTPNSTGTTLLGNTPKPGYSLNESASVSDINTVSVGVTKAGSMDNMIKFIISIGMLMGGLMITQQMGGAIGNIAGKGMSTIQKGQAFATSLPGRTGRAAIGAGATWMSQGRDFNPADGTTSLRGRFRDALGSIGGSRVIGINTLATNALTGLGARRRVDAEQAQRHVGNINDQRIISRLARQNSITPMGVAVRDAARNKMPSGMLAPGQVTRNVNGDITAVDPAALTALQNQIRGMSREEVQRLNSRELSELGRLGVTADEGTSFQDYLSSNRTSRRNFNEGVLSTHTGTSPRQLNNYVQGFNQNTGAVTGDTGITGMDYATLMSGVGYVGGAATVRGLNGVNPNRYSIDNNKHDSKGDGNISVNRFGRGQDNTIGVSFEDMPKGIFDDLEANVNLHQVEGVNITDQKKIQTISSHMSDVLTKKISEMQTSGGNAKQIELATAAKTKFDGIAKGTIKADNLSMVNSSAIGYKDMSNVKKAKIHEELHGHGVDNEKVVTKMSDNIIENKIYSKRKEVADNYNNKSVADSKEAFDDRANRHTSEDLGDANDALVESIENLTEKLGENTREAGSMANKFSDNLNKFGASTQKNIEEIVKNTDTVEKNTYITKQAIKNKKLL